MVIRLPAGAQGCCQRGSVPVGISKNALLVITYIIYAVSTLIDQSVSQSVCYLYTYLYINIFRRCKINIWMHLHSIASLNMTEALHMPHDFTKIHNMFTSKH